MASMMSDSDFWMYQWKVGYALAFAWAAPLSAHRLC